ncbi:hypothetical protein D9M69_510790 [compost metagenome]
MNKIRCDSEDKRQAQDNQTTGNDCYDDCAPENRLFFRLILRTHGLCHKAGRTRTQEAEHRQQKIENQRTDCQSANQFGLPHLPDHAHIHQPQQRRSDSGQRHRHGDHHHHAIGHFKWSGNDALFVQHLIHG